jgi:hypothetical protein
MAEMERLWSEGRSKDEVEKLRLGRLDGEVAVEGGLRSCIRTVATHELSILFR